MEKDEARLNYFKELRESGLTKLFEEDVRIFFGGMVESQGLCMRRDLLLWWLGTGLQKNNCCVCWRRTGHCCSYVELCRM